MKNFLRENSAAIVKFILTHVVMSVLGIMVGLAVLSIEGDADGFSVIAIVASAFTIGFMCFMHYDDMYFIAEKDGIRTRAEGGKLDVTKGIKISLVAYAPVLIIAIVAICVDIFASDDASAITRILYYAVQGSFIALYKLMDYVGYVGFVLITLIPALVASSLGYAMGLKDKTIRGAMGMNVKPPYDGPMERKPKNKNNNSD